MFYDSKLFAPNYYNNRAHPLGRFGYIVLAWSIVALAHCVSPKKRDALFCGCTPCHRAIITAVTHTLRVGVHRARARPLALARGLALPRNGWLQRTQQATANTLTDSVSPFALLLQGAPTTRLPLCKRGSLRSCACKGVIR